MEMKCFFLILALSMLVPDVNAWWWHSSCGNHKRHGKPYYFGTTNLFCMIRSKRSAYRDTLRPIHRWIYYDGLYYEFGTGSRKVPVVGWSPVQGQQCNAQREDNPAGYGVISHDCLKRCAERYISKYGRYNLVTNNCHKFANRMSDILCNYKSCPSWCYY